MKYGIVFLRLENSVYRVLKTLVKTELTTNVIAAFHKQFVVNLNEPNYRYKDKTLYLIDIDSGAQIMNHVAKTQIDPEKLDSIIGSKAMKLFTNAQISKKEQFKTVIVGAIIGFLVGSIIFMLYYTNQINEIQQQYIYDIKNPAELPPIIQSLGVMLKSCRI